MHTDQSGPAPARRPRPGPGAGPVDPLHGRILDGRYRVGPTIARGGMATVYEAVDLRLDRTVAVKVMHPHLVGHAHGGAGPDDPHDVAMRFVREARAAARLSHPHVVAVYDQGDDDGVVFLALEMVRGGTLRDVLAAEAPMPPGRALALLEPVLSALAAAHRAGLVHRDVKPENVLIAEDGTVKVADFGLARAVGADTRHTATQGVLIGTVSYLAPELVVEGRGDARADVYAAGVVLYEMLTGAKPHEGESPIHVAYQHVHADVPAPSARVPGLPAYVDALVARATARDRAQRPADADVLLRQVRRVAQAVADGVPEDPELVLDLRPSPLPVAAPEDPEDTPAAEDSAGTGPGPVAPRAAVVEHTTAYDARAAGAPPAPPARAAARATPAAPARRRRGLLLVLGLVLALVVVGGGYWAGWGRYTAAPAVLGVGVATAEDRLASAGLELDVVQESFSETVPAGRVISTDPGPGDRVLPGASVEAVVSLGQERYDVPALAGRGVDEAQDALLGLNLDPDDTVERWSEEAPEGTVVATRPAAGTTLRSGSPVDLVVSRGPRPRQVGDWVGQDYDTAAAALGERGLQPVVGGEAFDDTVPEGSVISQEPTGGTLFRGGTVTFTVSQGPELVAVPGVLAAGIDSATDTLEAAGFEVRIANDDSFVGLGFVVGSDPGEGEMVPRGSTITLYVV
ncbi:Stk1 family PASTA domain-containing Ser/Thr kinase [Nocardioides sp. AX2bis]|uniref:Stk1 family PASTA domain-containing Ser/Thr kinase n=1 Tax=Nocardioides sp. AX2bis TaxID=2653157 RepID=UPI0012EFFD48|nr:Stk1 family PASTA domain-containing Ser/Thr kinase [Nocardioides sp. AX2bis]VXB14897.1 Serine/threonine-protein kinase PK-1 [Nocardioides sp. AX2bis]